MLSFGCRIEKEEEMTTQEIREAILAIAKTTPDPGTVVQLVVLADKVTKDGS
jgi:hypothetical protein